MRRYIRWVPSALLLAVIVELVFFVLVARWIGFGWAMALVLVTSLSGGLLLRREGVRAWRGFRAAAAAGHPPGQQVTDGLVGLAAGLLLALPGLLSSVVGLLLALPPARGWARLGIQRAAERRVPSSVAGDLFGPRRVRVRQGTPRPATQPSPGTPTGVAIEGEIVEPPR